MSRRSSPPLWRWRRLIARAHEPLWTERMVASGAQNWMIVEKPGRVRLSLEAYFVAPRHAQALANRWGGRVSLALTKVAAPGPPIRLRDDLEIVHDPNVPRKKGRLTIPYGMAFGSGEHGTTLMLLRALAERRDLREVDLLDLGTGSGVLALVARALGARKVDATDFDADAIRTARGNEWLNFGSRKIGWAVADVNQLRPSPKYSLVLANLYSEVLIQAAPRLARALSAKGELWLSGVLRAQAQEVRGAFKSSGLHLSRSVTRGKWVMQRWTQTV